VRYRGDRGDGDVAGENYQKTYLCDEVNLFFQRFEDKGSL